MTEDSKGTIKKEVLFCTISVVGILLVILGVFFGYLLPKWPTFAANTIELDPLRRHFHDYMKKYNKNYDGEVYERRYRNYKATLKEIQEQNDRWYDTAHYSTNKFSDMTQEEFEQKMLMHEPLFDGCTKVDDGCIHGYKQSRKVRSEPLPSKFDWRNRGVIGPVLDQKLCCSCWAFSIVGVMESMLLITRQLSKYLRLSIQELTDCPVGYTHQCLGGNPELALQFLCNRQYPITTEKKYPLTLRNQTCRTETKGYIVDSYHVRCNMSAEDIAWQVVNHGPVVSLVNSAPWKNYNDGVIQFHCSGETLQEMNHVVQIVGYDMEDPEPHFIIRNSWGSDFGDHGYVKIAMENFTCGIGRQISYFDVSKL